VNRTATSLKYRYQRLSKRFKKDKIDSIEIESFYLKEQGRTVSEKSETISTFSFICPLDRTQDPTTHLERDISYFPLPDISFTQSKENTEPLPTFDSFNEFSFSSEFEDIFYQTSEFQI
jgi:hypothetical protein